VQKISLIASRFFQSLTVIAVYFGFWWLFHRYVLFQILLFGGVACAMIYQIITGKLNLNESPAEHPKIAASQAVPTDS